MKRNSILAMLLGGLFLVAGAGTAFSEWGDKPAGGMSGSESISAPDTGSMRPEAPVETGTLPKAEDLYKTPDSAIGETPAAENPGSPAPEVTESK
jgi:hypothetical protein